MSWQYFFFYPSYTLFVTAQVWFWLSMLFRLVCRLKVLVSHSSAEHRGHYDIIASLKRITAESLHWFPVWETAVLRAAGLGLHDVGTNAILKMSDYSSVLRALCKHRSACQKSQMVRWDVAVCCKSHWIELSKVYSKKVYIYIYPVYINLYIWSIHHASVWFYVILTNYKKFQQDSVWFF